MTVLGIAVVGFLAGSEVSYLIGYLMLRPNYETEARIHQSISGQSETDVARAILSMRAELTMIRSGIVLLNGFLAAIVTVQLF